MAKKPRLRKAPKITKVEPKPDAAKTSSTNRSRVTGAFLPAGRIFRPLRWIVPTYFVNSWRELKFVTWPTRRETWRLTAAVFIFATIFGILVAGVDKVLDLIFKKFILHI